MTVMKMHERRSVSTIGVRLLFFGVRYASILGIARLLGQEAGLFLLVIALSETARILFDFGMESTVIARLHLRRGTWRKDYRGLPGLRVCATIVGQTIISMAAVTIAVIQKGDAGVALLTSLHFGLLMLFGYMNAIAQSRGRSIRLITPLVVAAIVHACIFAMAWLEWVSVGIAIISFEVVSIIAAWWIVGPNDTGIGTFCNAFAPRCADRKAFLEGFEKVRSLGQAMILSLAYSRIDLLVLPLSVGGGMMIQYLSVQRLGSAPLMLSSAISSAVITWLSLQREHPVRWIKSSLSVLGFAYLTGAIVAGAILLFGDDLSMWLGVRSVDPRLQWIQSGVIGIQIANCFHAAVLISSGETERMYRIARNAAVVLVLLMPVFLWKGGILGIAMLVFVTELTVAGQYLIHFKTRAHV